MRNLIDIINGTLTEGEISSDNLLLLLEGAADPLGVVARIKELDTQFLTEYNATLDPHDKTAQYNATRMSPFHLASCHRCTSPVWKQPCPVCDYYPHGNMEHGMRIDSEEWNIFAQKSRAQAEEKFLDLCNLYGNLAGWFFESKKKTVAYSSNPSFAKIVDKYCEIARSLSLPDAQAIWNAYRN